MGNCCSAKPAKPKQVLIIPQTDPARPPSKEEIAVPQPLLQNVPTPPQEPKAGTPNVPKLLAENSKSPVVSNVDKVPKGLIIASVAPCRASLEEEKVNKTLEDAFRGSHNREPSSFSKMVYTQRKVPANSAEKFLPDEKTSALKENPRQSLYLVGAPADKQRQFVQTVQEGRRPEIARPSPCLPEQKKTVLYGSVCGKPPRESLKHRNISTTDTNFNKLLYNAAASGDDGASLLDRKEIVSILTNDNHLTSYIHKANMFKQIERSISKALVESGNNVEESEVKSKSELVPGCFFSVPQFDLQTLLSPEKKDSMALLEQSSKIMGEVYLVWSAPFESQKYYIRHDPPKCSGPNLCRIKDISGTPQVTTNAAGCCTIRQGDYPTSPIVCGIICIENYSQIFKNSSVNSLLYPRLNSSPIYNEYGYYGLRLQVNGTERLVELDDQMPCGPKKTMLNSHTDDKDDFWVPLVERGIMKLYGSSLATLPTSSSLEIFHLLNWIPEVVTFSEIANKEGLWTRLHQNFMDGNIMVCIGTGDIPDPIDPNARHRVSAATNLVANHVYAVLATESLKEGRFLKCKNPWGKLPSKLKYSPYDSESWTTELCRKLKYVPPFHDDNGTFWIRWQDVVENFPYLYLAWNPRLYPQRKVFHSSWRMETTLSAQLETTLLEYCPQYVFSIPPHPDDFEVRVVLQKHISEFSENGNRISFMLFNYDGCRIVYPINALREHKYSSREVFSDVFIFENSPEVEQYVFLILPDTQNCCSCSFSMSLYSFVDISIRELPLYEIHDTLRLEDKWGTHMGGELLSRNFVHNPQYNIKLEEKTHVQIRARCKDPHNISLILIVSGKDVRESDFENLTSNLSSGQYFASFAHFQAVLEPNSYTLILSVQEDSVVPEFSLEISRIKEPGLVYKKESISVERIVFPELPYKQIISGEWTKENSKGTYRILTDSYQVFFKNPGYVFKLDSTTELMCNLRATKGVPSTCIAIYEILDNNKFSMVYEDDSYAGRPWGYFTRKVTLPANTLGYLLLCITFERGSTGPFELEIMSTKKVSDILPSAQYFGKKNTKNILGNWTKISAGGCSTESTFALNPQYKLFVSPNETSNEGEVVLELSSHNQYPVGIGVLETNCPNVLPISEIDAADISQLKSNSSFLVELNTLRVRMKKGINYLVILSTYAAHQLGYFDFRVASDMVLEIEEIKLKTYIQKEILEGEFNSSNNKGTADESDLQTFIKNPSVFMQVNMMTDVRIHLYSRSDLVLRLDLFEISDSFEYNSVGNSGTYSPLKMGVYVEKRLHKGKKGYLIVCSCYGKEASGNFTLEIEANPKVPRMLIQDLPLKLDPTRFTDDDLETELAKNNT